MAYEHEAEEWRDARRAIRAGGIGHAHDMRPDGMGGGHCACGETVTRDEL